MSNIDRVVLKGIAEGIDDAVLQEEMTRLFRAPIEKVRARIEQLRNDEQIVVATDVPREKARAMVDAMRNIGLIAIYDTELKVVENDDQAYNNSDEEFTCPACGHRQKVSGEAYDTCEKCGVVRQNYEQYKRDKLILEQEQERVRQEMLRMQATKEDDDLEMKRARLEERKREEIRQRLEKAHGLGPMSRFLHGVRSGNPAQLGVLVVGGLAIGVAIYFTLQSSQTGQITVLDPTTRDAELNAATGSGTLDAGQIIANASQNPRLQEAALQMSAELAASLSTEVEMPAAVGEIPTSRLSNGVEFPNTLLTEQQKRAAAITLAEERLLMEDFDATQQLLTIIGSDNDPAVQRLQALMTASLARLRRPIDPQQAQRGMVAAVALASTIEDPIEQVRALSGVGGQALRAGDREAGIELLIRAHEAIENLPGSQERVIGRGELARHYYYGGDADASRSELLQGRADLERAIGTRRSWMAWELAMLAILSNELELSRQIAQQGGNAELNDERYTMMAVRALFKAAEGEQASIVGDSVTADADFVEAARLLSQLPEGHPQRIIGFGRLVSYLERNGRTVPARRYLRTALEALEVPHNATSTVSS